VGSALKSAVGGWQYAEGRGRTEMLGALSALFSLPTAGCRLQFAAVCRPQS